MFKFDKLERVHLEITNRWQTIWHDKWASNKSMCCTAMCSASSPFIKLSEQFQDA